MPQTQHVLSFIPANHPGMTRMIFHTKEAAQRTVRSFYAAKIASRKMLELEAVILYLADDFGREFICDVTVYSSCMYEPLSALAMAGKPGFEM